MYELWVDLNNSNFPYAYMLLDFHIGYIEKEILRCCCQNRKDNGQVKNKMELTFMDAFIYSLK